MPFPFYWQGKAFWKALTMLGYTPIAVDGAFIKLNRVVGLLQLGWGGLELGAHTAETSVGLEGVGPAAGFVIQHLQQVATTFLWWAEFLNETNIEGNEDMRLDAAVKWIASTTYTLSQLFRTSYSLSVVWTLHHLAMGSGITSHSSEALSKRRTKVDLPAAVSKRRNVPLVHVNNHFRPYHPATEWLVGYTICIIKSNK